MKYFIRARVFVVHCMPELQSQSLPAVLDISSCVYTAYCVLRINKCRMVTMRILNKSQSVSLIPQTGSRDPSITTFLIPDVPTEQPMLGLQCLGGTGDGDGESALCPAAVQPARLAGRVCRLTPSLTLAVPALDRLWLLHSTTSPAPVPRPGA